MSSSVSVSILTHNAGEWLEPAVRSIEAQTYPLLEITIVDNASTDGTPERAARLAAGTPSIRLVELDDNVGFGAGQNRGIAETGGDYICLLNQDVVLDSNFVAEAVSALDARADVAAVQGRLFRLGRSGERSGVIDSTGLVAFRSRRFVSRGQGDAGEGRYTSPGQVFGADGPAPVYRRSALIDATLRRPDGRPEIFDEDFFLYHEDTDLAWRLRLLGWQAWYVPTAVGWHARGSPGPSSLSPLALARHRVSLVQGSAALSWRNHRLMMVKNETLPGLARDLAHIVGREVASVGLLLVRGPERRAPAVGFLRGLSAARFKRRQIQSRRRVGRKDMAGWFA